MSAADGARRAERLLALALVAAVLLVHGRSLAFGFVAWDDLAHVSGNARFDPPTLPSLAQFWSGSFEHLYVPLAYSVWWGIAVLSRACVGRLEPAFFHGANLLLHVGCALLVLRWLSALLEDRRAAFAGALFFALHPLQVESVAWVSELRGLLAALLGFAALLAQFRGRRYSALALFALALLAKPSAVCFALFLPLLEFGWQRRSLGETLASSWPWLALAAGALAATRAAQPGEALQAVAPLADRPRVALDALGFYLEKLVWPAGLVADHGRSPAVVLAGGWPWLATLVVALALAAPLWLRERRRGLVALALSAAALLPVLGFVPFGFQEISTVADRYAYLALPGAALFLGLCLRSLGARAFAPAFALCAALGVASAVQAGYWRDTRTLFERVLERNPRSTVALDNLGYAAIERGEFEQACEYYRRSLELRPGNARALDDLGVAECDLGRFDPGLAHVRQAIAADPGYLRARENLVAGLGRSGRLPEAEAAAREFAALLPDEPRALLPLARVLRVRGQRDEAGSVLQRVLERAPGWRPALAERDALGR